MIQLVSHPVWNVVTILLILNYLGPVFPIKKFFYFSGFFFKEMLVLHLVKFSFHLAREVLFNIKEEKGTSVFTSWDYERQYRIFS